VPQCPIAGDANGGGLLYHTDGSDDGCSQEDGAEYVKVSQTIGRCVLRSVEDAGFVRRQNIIHQLYQR